LDSNSERQGGATETIIGGVTTFSRSATRSRAIVDGWKSGVHSLQPCVRVTVEGPMAQRAKLCLEHGRGKAAPPGPDECFAISLGRYQVLIRC
jgi:hypothetical protein